MSHILSLLSTPWACLPEHHEMVYGLAEAWARGERADLEALKAGGKLPGPSQGYEVRDGVAIIPLMGTLSPRVNLTTEVSGGTSSELLARDIRMAADDPQVAGIILQVDSPGGAVAGTQAAASAVMAARRTKPVVTLGEGTIASGAYWIGSAGDQLFLSSATDMAGSIGVRMIHRDMSRAEEAAGIKTTEIVAGKWKSLGSEHGPLTESGQKALQDRVDAIYRVFVGDVANQRGRSTEQVLSDMADGRVFVGQEAIDAGLADGFASIDELVQEVRDRAKKRTAIGSGYGIIKQSTPVVSMTSLSRYVHPAS
jgi:signal peptide peptidase SppA